MFADVEELLVVELARVDGIVRVGTSTPFDLARQCPLLRVQRIGGADDHLTDTARVDVDTFATNKDQARLLARVVHAYVLALRHNTVGATNGAGGVVVDTVETVTGPMWVDYDDEHVHRYVATYEIATRTQ